MIWEYNGLYKKQTSVRFERPIFLYKFFISLSVESESEVSDSGEDSSDEEPLVKKKKNEPPTVCRIYAMEHFPVSIKISKFN